MLDTSDRRSVRAAEKASKFADRQRGEVLVNLMSTTYGRLWVWGLLERGSIFSSTFADDPYRSAFLEGRRSAGLDLLADIMQWCPNEFILAMREANDRRTESSTRADSASNAERSGFEDTDRGIEGSTDSGD